MNNSIDQYRKLRDRTEKVCESLTKIHDEDIVCAKGCCHCCVNLSVFPVEFYSILEELKSAGAKKLSFDEKTACGFLADKLCTIYNCRPLICRTHGLPIVFLNEEIDPPQYSVSFCDDNFTQANFDTLEFGAENTLNIDELNDELFRINMDFVEKSKDESLTPTTRIELRKLCDFL